MSESTYLFAVPSWVEGVGRIFDFGDALSEYNYSATPEDADAVATYLDWSAVGGDLRRAIGEFERQSA
jgi:hypothetical protein